MRLSIRTDAEALVAHSAKIAASASASSSWSVYVAKTGTLTFAPGETTKTITIEVNGDSKKEANETFYLDLFGVN
jgi:hypothetical protein